MELNPAAYRKRLEECVEFFRQHWGEAPAWALVFGSGLGSTFKNKCPPTKTLSYESIPYFPNAGVEGHLGLMGLYAAGKNFSASGVAMHGRSHYYQGLEPWEVVFPVRALALWGVRRFLLTNASGSIHPRYQPGRLALITDHLNFNGHNPLRGPNLDFLGTRFPSLNQLYQNSLSTKCLQAAKKIKMPLLKGVYVGTSGPSYETPAEVKAYRQLGGHFVGMSTVDEAIAIAHAGGEVAALSALTNRAGGQDVPDHEEVLQVAGKVDIQLAKLLNPFLRAL